MKKKKKIFFLINVKIKYQITYNLIKPNEKLNTPNK